MTQSYFAAALGISVGVLPLFANAQPGPPNAPDERLLGDLVITGTQVEHFTKLAVLKSYSPDYEDVVVRSVVRHDLELSGMFDMIADSKAPAGNYSFDDAVDLPAWQKVGAEVIVKQPTTRA